ncbi:MAG: haloacid dehalogenase-like hydrolase, partial [Firmicutes bacterium]|nr:haloacid dehalogenase-like hydrolase [Bacillota bacterium]
MTGPMDKKNSDINPILAICYDFDKTLSPDNMQAQGYIQDTYGGEAVEFWRETDELAEKHEMDENLAYMYKMVEAARGRIVLTRKSLEAYGAKVKFFNGVAEWFERIKKYGAEKGIEVEHYIISSGLKEMIEGTSVAKAGAF